MDYKQARSEMANGAGASLPVQIIIAYLDRLQHVYASRFDAVKALQSLIDWCEVFKKTLAQQ
jgi:hypothetical protein